MVEREKSPRAEALDLEGPAELAAEGPEWSTASGATSTNGRYARATGTAASATTVTTSRRPRARQPATARSGTRQAVELHRNPDSHHDGAPSQTAGQHEDDRAGDERGRDEVESRQDHAAEEGRDERDDGEREPSLVPRPAQHVEPLGEQEHADPTGDRHLRGEHGTVRGERVRHERRQHEGRQRTGWILEREVAIRNEQRAIPRRRVR